MPPPSNIRFPFVIKPGMKDGYVKVQKNLDAMARYFMVAKAEGEVPVWDVDRKRYVPGPGGGGKGASFEIKLFKDGQFNVAGGEPFTFAIPEDLDGIDLENVEIYVTSPSTANKPTVQLYNATTGHNMLSTPVSIDVGEKNSKFAFVPVQIDAARKTVSWTDEIDVVTTIAGADAQGLGVIITFGTPAGGGGIGPPGPAGPAGSSYTHTQSAVSATWIVVHNMGVHPSVSVVDTGDSVVLPDIQYNTLNQLTLTFGAPTSGKAYLN